MLVKYLLIIRSEGFIPPRSELLKNFDISHDTIIINKYRSVALIIKQPNVGGIM